MNVGTKIIAVYSVGNYQRPCVTLVATMMHCLDGGTDSRSTLCVNLIYFNNDNLSKLDLSIGMIGLLRFGSNKFVLVYKYKGGGF